MKSFWLLLGLAACSTSSGPPTQPVPVVDPPGSATPVVVAPATSQTTSEAVNDGPACGSRGLAPCADGKFCSFPTTAHCGETDAPGRCRVRPEMCTKIFAPVCGCDHKTYGSECDAASHGQSVASVGACPDH